MFWTKYECELLFIVYLRYKHWKGKFDRNLKNMKKENKILFLLLKYPLYDNQDIGIFYSLIFYDNEYIQ